MMSIYKCLVFIQRGNNVHDMDYNKAKRGIEELLTQHLF